jgi:hypothetical protein
VTVYSASPCACTPLGGGRARDENDELRSQARTCSRLSVVGLQVGGRSTRGWTDDLRARLSDDVVSAVDQALACVALEAQLALTHGSTRKLQNHNKVLRERIAAAEARSSADSATLADQQARLADQNAQLALGGRGLLARQVAVLSGRNATLDAELKAERAEVARLNPE